jgi:hypothetical protein
MFARRRNSPSGESVRHSQVGTLAATKFSLINEIV